MCRSHTDSGLGHEVEHLYRLALQGRATDDCLPIDREPLCAYSAKSSVQSVRAASDSHPSWMAHDYREVRLAQPQCIGKDRVEHRL